MPTPPGGNNPKGNPNFVKGHQLAWKKGKSGNPAGRPKTSIDFARRMREAFNAAPEGQKMSLADVVLGIAFDGRNPKQMDAIKFCAAYGIGTPAKNLDNDTVKRLATEMMEQAIEEARKKRALEDAAPITGQSDHK